MSTHYLRGNPYAVDASCLDSDPKQGLVAATLALAFEQRTAAMAVLLGADVTVPGVDYKVLGHQIVARLHPIHTKEG